MLDRKAEYMKITILMGSPRKKDSYNICKEIEANIIEKDSGAEFDYIFLKDYNIADCKGCSLCFQKSEEMCPCKGDDLYKLKQKLLEADAIIVASPVYAYHVPSPLKKVIDRLSYLFHRQEMIAKPTMIVVTTDGGGSKEVYQYLKMTLSGWGLDIVGNIQIISPMYFETRLSAGAWGFDESYYKKMKDKILKLSNNLYQQIKTSDKKIPSFYDIFMFNCLRSKTYTSKADYNYWNEKGWIDSNYFYDVKLGVFKKIFGFAIKTLIAKLGEKYKKD
jgi:multimeric flavodoxin WrbA